MKTGAILRSKGCEFDALFEMLSDANHNQCEPPLPSKEVMGMAAFLASKPVSSQSHHPLGTVNHDDEIDQTPFIITSSSCLEDEDSGQTKYGDMFIEGKAYMEKRNEEPIEWLIEDLLPLSYLAVVGATSKCGKSCFITQLADCITHGIPLLGKKPEML
jgi:AAA domain